MQGLKLIVYEALSYYMCVLILLYVSSYYYICVLILLCVLMLQVGAAVSMVYVTGQPVVLVGVGQTYTDLKKLNAHNIVKLLLR